MSRGMLVPLPLCIIILVGIPGVGSGVYEKTVEIKKNLYVAASETLGGTRLNIGRVHILPVLRNQLAAIFLNEVILVLRLLAFSDFSRKYICPLCSSFR
jgi:peptide/nickel transport system permease protein